MKVYQYNFYNLDWKYLGCVWAGNPLFDHKVDGDFTRTVWNGKMLTKDGVEIDNCKPIEVHMKFMTAQEVKHE